MIASHSAFALKIIVFTALLFAGIRSVRADANADAARDARWSQDLDLFQFALPQRQIAFYKLLPREQFEKEMSEIRAAVPHLSDRDIALRLMRVVAELGVAHSWIVLPESGPLAFAHYPLEFRWFSDGLAVVAAAPEYQSALGARVDRIGTMTPEELETNLAPYISHENKTWLRYQSSNFMNNVELLRSLELADASARVELTLTKPGGDHAAMQLTPAKSNFTLVSARTALNIPPPLYARRSDLYWYEYLQDSKTLYIQYRVCAEDPKNPFVDFAKSLFAFADSHTIQRTVVDLRLNSGGNSEVVTPLLEGIKARPQLNAKGHLFVLIGPMTFSTGEWTAEELHNSFASLTSQTVDGFVWVRPSSADVWKIPFNATFVGEPTGGKPNCFGEVHSFGLPNSGITVNYAVKHFQLTDDGDPPSREPDIVVTRSREDFLAGRDPVLDAVIEMADHR